MRTINQINLIKSRISDPYAIQNFLSIEDINHLISLYTQEKQTVNSPVVYKNTGPVTLDLLPYISNPVVNTIISKLKLELGNFEITAAFFFWTSSPHIIHNDDTFELPDGVYKAITLPLHVDGEYTPKLCFFNQFYFHGPAKFFKGSANIPTFYNQQLYDYANVDGLVEDSKIDDPDKLLTHLNPKWLDGLSLHSSIDWIPTSAIIFDSTRLHCASNFKQLGISSKLGISIFTKVA